jgi:hypothetical protein
MEQRTYYRDVLQRKGALSEKIASIINGICSYPRLLLEVFIRRNFGQRYFSMLHVWIVTLFCGSIPLLTGKLFFKRLHGMDDVIQHFWDWYLFLGLFLVFSFIRRSEIKSDPEVKDFSKYSLYEGDVANFFWNLGGRAWSPRQVETLLEPGAFFLIGLVLLFIGLPVGGLILVSSVMYSFGYSIAYNQGDHYILDLIDQKLLNKALMQTFVEGEKDYKGFRFRGLRPVDENLRQELIKEMVEEEEIVRVE